MSRWKPRRPSPAFVLAAIALFAALGGTGYAATTIVAPAHTAAKKAKPLTKSQVNKLVAAYVKAHKSSLRGATGKTGSTGGQGAPGAPGKNGVNGINGKDGAPGKQGPGAIRVASVGSSANSGAQPVATVGPWTVTLACTPNAQAATVKITGPGAFQYSTAVGDLGVAGTANTLQDSPINSGKTFSIADGKALALEGYLSSDSTLYRIDLHVDASNGGLFESCPLTGSAIPIP